MNTKRLQLSTLIFLIAGFFFAACDSVDDDQLPVVEQGDFDSETFLAPGSLAIIDISSGVKSNQALKLTITNAPTFGRLESIGGPLLKYRPNENFTEGLDFLNVEIKSAADEFLGNKKVRINVSRDSTDLPCTVIAFADFARTPVGQPVLVNVLENDWDCESQRIDSTSLFIQQPPTNGQATVIGSQIKFDPQPGYSGIAELIYGISSLDDSVSSFGLVQIYVGKDSVSNCMTLLYDDSVFFDHNIDSTLFINALQNDSLCSQTIQQVNILTPPDFGQVTVLPNDSSAWLFKYQLDSLPTSGNDQFTYQVCDSINCYEAQVFVKFDQCVLRANPDYFVINSDSSIYTNNTYPLDVLLNDQYCDKDSVQLRIVSPTANGEVSISDRQLVYATNAAGNHADSLIYEICSGSQRCDSARVYIDFQN